MIRARKRFGQHFLEPAWVQKVVDAIAPGPGDTFIEIGPGRGALTRPLLHRAGAVVAFEIDRELADDLTASDLPRLTVVEGDFLESTWIETHLTDVVPGRRLRVAGNLPYNVASPILFKLAALYAAGVRFEDVTVMLQREVADRLLAEPGTHEYGVLAVLLRHVADVQPVLMLPAGAFRPVPRVRSALVRIRFREPRPPARDPALFTRLVRSVFTRRRKMLSNALLAFTPPDGMAGGEALTRAGIDGHRRPETLAIAELVALADAYVLP